VNVQPKLSEALKKFRCGSFDKVYHVTSKGFPVRKAIIHVLECREKQSSSAGRLMSMGYLGAVFCR